MMGFRGKGFQGGYRTVLIQLCMPSIGMTWPTSRQGRLGALRAASAIDKLRRDLCVDGADKHCAGLAHRMHCDCEFAGHSYGGALETEALLEPESPVAQVALRETAGQDDQGRLIEKSPQVGISSAGDASAIVKLP